MRDKDLDNLLRLLKLVGGKFILVEEGKPKTVLMSYEEFQEIAAPFYAGKLADQLSSAEIVNKEITSAQAQDLNNHLMEEVVQIDEIDEQQIRIEPLDGALDSRF